MGNLNLPTIAAGQRSMYQTSNDADDAIDLAVTDNLNLDLSAGDVTLTADQMVRAIAFIATGNTVARTLNLPVAKRLFAVRNKGSHALDVTLGTTTVSVAATDAAILYTDGTANGLDTVIGSSGASGTAGGDLTGTYPNPTIGANKVGNTKLAQMATHTIKGNNTGGSSDPIDLTVAQTKTLLAIAAGDVSGLATSATTDTTNASNISSGTLDNARLSGVELTANKGTNNGYASLDSGGKVPTAQLPAAVLGAVDYQGTWNASTNSPAISSSSASSANKGFYYKVSTAGTTTVDGISDWGVGDWIISDGVSWGKIDNTEAVISVNGQTGAVSLSASDLAAIADSRIVANVSGGSAAPSANTLTAVLDHILGNTQGSIIYRDGSGWTVLAPGTADQVAKTGGAGANPSWADVGSLLTPGADIDISSSTIKVKYYAVGCWIAGLPSNSEKVLRYYFDMAVTLPASLTNSIAKAGTASTGSVSFQLQKNGSNIGTVDFAASATGAFTFASPVAFAAGDRLDIIAPAAADATLADIAITLQGTR